MSAIEKNSLEASLASSRTEPRAAIIPDRLPALDWMRGLVMVLMTIDHASEAFNGGRLVTDAAWFYRPGTHLPLAQFLTRWISHLCAPTFVFLAGTALALSAEKRLLRGESPRTIDRYLLVRGVFIAALDPLWMSWVFAPGALLFQVMYAIGASFICMIPLRRLRTAWLLALALGWIIFGEGLTAPTIATSVGNRSLLTALLIAGGLFQNVLHTILFVAYPLIPWLAYMLLGWAFGRYLLNLRGGPTTKKKVERLLALTGALAMILFLAVRGFNRYGNMVLLREDGSLAQWLHVSKYPPSLSFSALELGLMALLLWAFFVVQRRMKTPVSPWNPLLVFGQTALFFYVLHAHLLILSSYALGLHHKLGLGATYFSTLIGLLILYPVCIWYRRYKASHADGWARYL